MITSYLQALINALGFLTRIPLPHHWFSQKLNVCDTSWAFPIIGAFIGFISSIIFIISNYLMLGTYISALLGIVTTIFLTGALHEDGLGDVFDGFFSKTKIEDRLAVMKDSQIGTFAALALIVCIVFRILIIVKLANYSISIACTSLIALEATSRGFMVWFWGLLPLARQGGTADAAGVLNEKNRYIALTLSCFIAFILIFIPLTFLSFLYACFLGIFVSFMFSKLCLKKINGYTGDTLGACQQLSWAASAIGIIIGIHFSF